MDDVLVVGAGIVGLLCALTLREQGASVRVLDAGASRPSASWAGGGILSPLFPWRYPDSVTALTRDAVDEYRVWCEAIADLGLPAELNQCGMYVDQSAGEDILAWGARHGISVEGRDCSSVFPGLPSREGVWMSTVAAIRNPHMLSGLRELAAHRGVLIESAVVETLLANGAGVETDSGDRLEADRLLLTAGHWNARLAGDRLESDLLFPVRGQMLLYRLPSGTLPAILLAEHGYLIPRHDGLVLAGSTLEPGVSDCLPTAEGEQQLRRMAEGLLPALANHQPIAHWAGIRPGCSRPQPVIRPLDDGERCWLIGGHYRNGLVSAPATARLVADLVQGRPGFVDPSPYR